MHCWRATTIGRVIYTVSQKKHPRYFSCNSRKHSGADPAIGGPGGRLPLWAALSEKTGFFRL